MKNKIKLYKDELNDDFQNTKTSLKVTVDENYVYESKNIFFRMFSFCIFYFVALPVIKILDFILYRPRINGRKNLRALKNTGYFIYANHTHFTDSWLAQINLAPLRKPFIIANKDAIQIPVVDVLVKALGTLPVPDTIGGLKNLNKTVEKHIRNKKIFMIYPEAHIWPYYTKVRPFKTTSFKFAANTNSPCVPVAICYKHKKLFGSKRKPRAHIYVGKPIYPNPELSTKQNAEDLKNQVFEYINQKVKTESTYAYYEYIKLEDNQTPFQTANKKQTLQNQIEIQETEKRAI